MVVEPKRTPLSSALKNLAEEAGLGPPYFVFGEVRRRSRRRPQSHRGRRIRRRRIRRRRRTRLRG